MKYTLAQFNNTFPTNDLCLEAIKNLRFPQGIHCAICKEVTNHYKVTGRTSYACAFCGSHVYPLAGTIFEHSSTPLTLWLYAMYLMTQTRSGMSAKQLERMLGVTYKTAWRMFRQIRKLMDEGNQTLDGIVEVDESFFGGAGKNRRYVPHFNEKPKDIIMGMVERKGKVVMKKIETTGKYALQEQIAKHISPTAIVMTDEWRGYMQLPKLGYEHHVVNHGKTFVTDKVVHTENIEGLWGRIKPAVRGVYRKISSKYIESYMNEYCFRYNNRKTPELMFDLLLARVASIA